MYIHMPAAMLSSRDILSFSPRIHNNLILNFMSPHLACVSHASYVTTRLFQVAYTVWARPWTSPQFFIHSFPYFFPLWLYSPTQALAASMKLSVSLQLLDLGQSVGLLGRVISPSQGLSTCIQTQKRTHNTNTKKKSMP
jgi:hypothetical protein